MVDFHTFGQKCGSRHSPHFCLTLCTYGIFFEIGRRIATVSEGTPPPKPITMDEVDDFDKDIEYPAGFQDDCAVASASAGTVVANVALADGDAQAPATTEDAVSNKDDSGKVLPGKPPVKNCRKGVPNYSTPEVIATVWAYIAMSEEEAIQTMQSQ